MPDANKTQLTRQITKLAAEWLDGKGFRPVETEVSVADSWVADVASFCYPTRTEAQQLKLIARKPSETKGDRLHPRDPNTPLEKWDRSYLALPQPITAIVEVKTSLFDFTRDGKWDQPAPAHLMYVAVPDGLILPAALNEHWGLLVAGPAGGIRLHVFPELREAGINQTLRVICQIAMRRDNVTRHIRSREFDRQAREITNGRINRQRLSSAVEVVLAILDGKPVAEAIQWYRRHGDNWESLPKWEREQFELLSDRAKTLAAEATEAP